MGAIIIAILLFVPQELFALEPWTKTDTAFQSAVIVTQIIDWKQTRSIAKDKWWPEGSSDRHSTKPDKSECEEGFASAFIGEHPTVSRVNWYFTGAILGDAVVARILPQPYRRVWQVLSIGVEGYFIQHNYRLGIRFNF